MSTIQDVSAEQLAKLFHHYQQTLAQNGDQCGGESVNWDRTPHHERKLIVATARLALLELATTPARPTVDRKYLAKPGEADWGC